MVMKTREEQIKNATVQIGNTVKVNKRLLDKKLSIELFKETAEELFKEHSEYYKPKHFNTIVYKLFSMKNVFVATAPCEDFFDKKGKWITEIPTRSHRSLEAFDIIDSIQNYLNEGALVYLYTFYSMKQDIVTGYRNNDFTDTIVEPNVDTYWWRLIVKKEE